MHVSETKQSLENHEPTIVDIIEVRMGILRIINNERAAEPITVLCSCVSGQVFDKSRKLKILYIDENGTSKSQLVWVLRNCKGMNL